MNKSPLRIGTLNVRSIFKDAHPQLRQHFLTHLKSRSLHLDILCIQDVLPSQAAAFTDSHLSKFRTFLFPSMSTHANWHTAVICINPQLSVKEARDFIDGRCSLVSIRDHRDNLICSILNLYIPPTLAERRFFFDALMSEVPIFSASYDQTPPTFILGDFNTDMTDRTFRGHPLVSP